MTTYDIMNLPNFKKYRNKLMLDLDNELNEVFLLIAKDKSEDEITKLTGYELLTIKEIKWQWGIRQTKKGILKGKLKEYQAIFNQIEGDIVDIKLNDELMGYARTNDKTYYFKLKKGINRANDKLTLEVR